MLEPDAEPGAPEVSHGPIVRTHRPLWAAPPAVPLHLPGPVRHAPGPGPRPPGYYLGWPLANIVKRLVAAFVDWGFFWTLALIVVGLIDVSVRAVFGPDAGAIVATVLFFGIYALAYYNTAIRQHRTGQSWGKQLLGLRLVTVVELRPPTRLVLSLRPLVEVLGISCCGVGLLVPLFSPRRQSLSDYIFSTVVLDERRAGMTVAWAVPQEPVAHLEAPQPQGGVPLPKRPRPQPPSALTTNVHRVRSGQAALVRGRPQRCRRWLRTRARSRRWAAKTSG
jgi:uncharacterized RDD family membrane protein YckC